MDEDFVGCLTLLIGVIVLWLGWPVALWFIIVVIIASILHYSAASIQPANSSDLPSFWQVALPEFRNVVSCIAIGLGIITLTQVIFSATDFFSTSTVKRWEEAVTHTQHHLSTVMSPSVLLSILGAIVLVSFLLPNKQFVTRFVKARKFAGWVLIVLTTVASFTFFSSLAVSINEPKWVAKRRSESQEAVNTIENGRRELVAVVWIEQSLKSLPSSTKREVRVLLIAAQQRPDGPDGALVTMAEKLASSAPPIENEGQSQRTGALQKVSAWLEFKGPTPNLEDVSAVVQEARKTNEALKQAQAAAEEALKTIVGSAIPTSIDPLLRPFIKALTSALVKTSLSRLSVNNINDYHVAVVFAKDKLKWSWRFSQRNGTHEGGYGDSPGGVPGSTPNFPGVIGGSGFGHGTIGSPGVGHPPIGPIRTGPRTVSRPGVVR